MEIVPFVSQVARCGMGYQSRLGKHRLLKILNPVLNDGFHLVVQRLRMAPARKGAISRPHYYYFHY